MSTHISLNEASKLCERSTTWVRNQAKKLEKEGRASKKSGKWLIEREAIISLILVKKTPQKSEELSPKVTLESKLETQFRAQIDELKEDKKRLIDEVERLNSENFSLRSELKTLLESKSGKGLKDIVSRWIRI